MNDLSSLQRMLVAALALTAILTAEELSASPSSAPVEAPTCGFDGVPCPMSGDFDPISVEMEPLPWSSGPRVTAPSAPAFGALVYRDFKAIEARAREHLGRGLALRKVLSPYQGNVEFETYVKKMDYSAGVDHWSTRVYTGAAGYGHVSLAETIRRAESDFRAARDLYAYLVVFAPEERFRGDTDYVSTPADPADLCGEPDKEDPDPDADGDPETPEVKEPVIDWCNFRARLRQSVREAAYVRMIFGQQFMIDGLGSPFGAGLLGGEDKVRQELAQFRAARTQFGLTEALLAEAMTHVVGNGCYVSDFYEGTEWALLSRSIEQRELAQHHIAMRRSYLDIDDAADTLAHRAAALAQYRDAAATGYIGMVGLAGAAARPIGSAHCAIGASPDSHLVAELALSLLETSRRANTMAEGRNVFGFDTAFTPDWPYDSEYPDPDGLKQKAEDALTALQASESALQSSERLCDDSQEKLKDAVEAIQEKVDTRLEDVSDCDPSGGDEAFFACIQQQQDNLVQCASKVDSPAESTEFNTCMDATGSAQVKGGDAKSALEDLRAQYLDYLLLEARAANINTRIQYSNDCNAVVTDWLYASGAAETAARVSQAAMDLIGSMDFNIADIALSGGSKDVALGIAGGVNIGMQAAAGVTSMLADVEIEDAENNKEVKNMLLDQSEILIEALGAQQRYRAAATGFGAMIDGLTADVIEARRQRAHFEHLPANDPSYRMARDASRLAVAQALDRAGRYAYIAARRWEYETASIAFSDQPTLKFRIADIYKARTSGDVGEYLADLSELDFARALHPTAAEFDVSIARHWLGLTNQALAEEGFTDPVERDAKRTERFREWVAANTVPNDFEAPYDGKDVLQFHMTTSLEPGGLWERLGVYDDAWLLMLGDAQRIDLRGEFTEQEILDMSSYRRVRLTQWGTMHLRSFGGCVFDFHLMHPAWMWGLAWPSNQNPAAATASWRASINDSTTTGLETPELEGRPASTTDWDFKVYSYLQSADMQDMPLDELTDVVVTFDTTYASREPGEPGDPGPLDCTRVGW